MTERDSGRSLSRLTIGPLGLRCEGDVLVIERGAEERRLPLAGLWAIARRYGRDLTDGVEVAGDFLTLPAGEKLRVISYRSPVDVIANEHVVLEGGACLAVPAPLFVAALAALAWR